MKKFILIVTSSVVLLSCKKNTDEMVDPGTNQPGLAFSFKFSGNYNEANGKTTATTAGTPAFTTDRKGTPNSAVILDGGSKVSIGKVSLEKNSFCVSVWIAKGEADVVSSKNIINISNLIFGQSDNLIYGAVTIPSTKSVNTECPDLNWHHYVVSYDGSDIRMYVDGVFKDIKNHPGNAVASEVNMILGNDGGSGYWKGKIDDLMIFNKLLSAEEILALSKE